MSWKISSYPLLRDTSACLRLRRYRARTSADPGAGQAKGLWSLLKWAVANFAAADLDGLVRIVKRQLKKTRCRLHLIDGCLAGTGLTIEPWCPVQLTSATGASHQLGFEESP